MRTRYLLLHPAEAPTMVDLQRDSQPVAEALGVSDYDARQRLVGTGLSVMARCQSAAEADALSDRLRALDVRHFIHDQQAEAHRQPQRARRAEVNGGQLVLLGDEDEELARLGSKDRVLAVSVGILDPARLFDEGRPHPESIDEDSRFDLVCADGRWFSIYPTGFLIEGASVSTAKPALLLEHLESCGVQVERHDGFAANFGRPVGALARRRYPCWAWRGWQQGMLLAGARVEILAPMARGTVDPVQVVVPLVPIVQPLRVTAVPALGRRLEVPGKPSLWLTIGLVGAGIGVLSGHLFTLLPILALPLLVSALHAGDWWLKAARAQRRLVPGPMVMVHGEGSTLEPVSLPGGPPACWYQVRLERWAQHGVVTDFLLRGHHRNPFRRMWGRGGYWTTAVEGDSGGLPFVLEGAQGDAVIAPDGAWFLVESSRDTKEETFRTTQRLLSVGGPLTVLGRARPDDRLGDALRRLKQSPGALARYDVNGDGRLDAEEWAEARAATEARLGEAVLSFRREHGPLLISDLPPDRVLSQLRTRCLLPGVAWLILALGALV
jgi:hypothetical protein